MHIALNIATRRHLYFWVDLYWCNFWNPSTLKTHQLREPPPQPYEHESPKIQFQMSDIFSPRSLHHSCVVTVHWHPCQSLSSAIIPATSLSTCSLGAWIVCHDLCARNAAFTFLSRTQCCLMPSLRQKIEIFNPRPYDLRRPFIHSITYSFVHLFLFTHIFTSYVNIINFFRFIQQIINVLSTLKHTNKQK